MILITPETFKLAVDRLESKGVSNEDYQAILAGLEELHNKVANALTLNLEDLNNDEEKEAKELLELVIRPSLIVFQNDLEHWNLDEFPEEAKPYLIGIETVYLYDSNQHTYACEITPSYCLQPIQTRAVFNTEYYERDDVDELNDEVDSFIWEACTEKQVEYYHVSNIQKILSNWDEAKKKKYYTELEPEFDYIKDGEPREKGFEKVEEYCNCNQMI